MLPAASPLSDWLTWLETLSPNEIELGLDRVRSVFERLDLSLPAHVLLVAGTNGKGSSVAMLAAILRASGLRVGAYTSPHINDYNERIVVGTDAATDEQIIAAFEKIEAVRRDVPLTYFEFGCARRGSAARPRSRAGPRGPRARASARRAGPPPSRTGRPPPR